MRSDEEQIIRLLTDEHNRAILTVLDDEARELPLAELAERLVTRGETVFESADYERELERVLVSLHHSRLPKLAEAGLVEYDSDETVVSREDSSAVDPEWLDVELVDELLARFRTESGADEDELGVIVGRESVIEYGRRLADEAEDELFLMYVSDDLLESECLRHARDALDRGVDISLGSRDSGVRDLVREQLPEVELWEPQFDWTNAPSTYPRVGRLVLADRDRVMLGMVAESDGERTTAERAVIGRGEENPLVVLVRDLLGPRIDHLDYQSETFRSELPFES